MHSGVSKEWREHVAKHAFIRMLTRHERALGRPAVWYHFGLDDIAPFQEREEVGGGSLGDHQRLHVRPGLADRKRAHDHHEKDHDDVSTGPRPARVRIELLCRVH